jgi:glycosyltransferase involved in cell wall biosynthesis
LLELPDRAPLGNGVFTVGYVGNLGIAQGLGILLDAAESLRDEPVQFTLVGGGPLTEELRSQALARGLTNFELRPGVPTKEVGPVLQSCDALVIPLRDHPVLADFIPSKLYDAMAVGRPALVATRGEAADLTERNDAGLVVPPEDGAALATAIRRLRGDAELCRRLGQNGRKAAGGFARSRQLGRLEDVLIAAARAT